MEELVRKACKRLEQIRIGHDRQKQANIGHDILGWVRIFQEGNRAGQDRIGIVEKPNTF